MPAGTKGKGKEKAADREIIPIPANDDDVELSEEDLDLLEEYGDAVGFLGKLDRKGIAMCVALLIMPISQF